MTGRNHFKLLAILCFLAHSVASFGLYFYAKNHLQNRKRHLIEGDLILEGFRVPERSLEKLHNIRDNFISIAPDKDKSGQIAPQRFYIENVHEIYIKFQSSFNLISHKLPSEQYGDIFVPQVLSPGLHYFDLDLKNLRFNLKFGT